MQRINSSWRVLPVNFLGLRGLTQRLRTPNLNFWLGYLLLNAALFVPAFLLNADATTFLPTTDAESLRSHLFRLFIWRENLDVFRLNLELTLIVTAWLFVARIRRNVFRTVFTGAYLFMLIYYVYESAMLYLYRSNPVFLSDFYLARDALGFLFENTQMSRGDAWFGAIFLISLLTLLTFGFLRTLHQAAAAPLHRLTRNGIAGIAIAGLTFALFYQSVLAHPMMVTSSAIFKVAENLSASIATYRNILRLGEMEIQNAYDYQQFRLETTPDVYLIFIESYGSVLYKRPDYQAQYANLTTQVRRLLHENDWHVASALSEAPTWGGGSWLAYTSMLYGLRIENHPEYLTLVDKFTLSEETYPHLPTYLQDQGYQFVWLSALSDHLSENQWARYRRFYGFDRLIRYRDLNYTGPHYGWGPSPPDQYSLSFAHANAIEPFEGPSFLFFITQNAHFPWAPIPPVLEDWRDFLVMPDEVDPEPVELIEHAQLRARYMDSIVYSFDFLVDFILNQGDPDAVYIILGDHQPPRVSRRSDNLDTPLHIISRDAAFVQGLNQYGFEIGTLFLREQTPTLRHEGLYSLLVRHLNEYYGTDSADLPVYYPEGFSIYEYIEPMIEEEDAPDEATP